MNTLSVTDLREKLSYVTTRVKRTKSPIPVLANNKVQFYVMSEQEHEHYLRLQALQQMDEEVEFAENFGKKYKKPADLLRDLIA
jgi:PHD/YefM family antitoxin component YafN of YafNO toxin-antitoxin module